MLNPSLDNYLLSKEEYKAYARHIILDNIGSSGQKRLKYAKILCIGAGGLGCPSLLYLAASGIGSIGIIDPDTVSKSNLHRQILYNSDNIHELKTASAKQKIQQVNPDCKINIYSYQLNIKNAYQIIQPYDIILDTCDNFTTRYIIDSVCYKLHKIHVYGAIETFEGQISVFNYKNGPKYSDLYPANLNLKNDTCNNLGVLGVLPGVIGIVQATEVIKIITGIGKILSGDLLIYNALNMSFKKIKIPKRGYCMQPLVLNPKINCNQNIILSSQLQETISNNNYCKIKIIDVRQPLEYTQQHIKYSINIPLKDITHKYNIDFIHNIIQTKTLIIYCSNNSRSIIASNILNQYKIKHLRLVNGLQEWLNLFNE